MFKCEFEFTEYLGGTEYLFAIYQTSQICGLYYKQVTIVIYDRNDSGQYYKTTITIIIDDPILS